MELNEKNLNQKETILGVPISEVRRQCEFNQEVPFDQPLNPYENPIESVIDGSKKILNDKKTLKRVRAIYRK